MAEKSIIILFIYANVPVFYAIVPGNDAWQNN